MTVYSVKAQNHVFLDSIAANKGIYEIESGRQAKAELQTQRQLNEVLTNDRNAADRQIVNLNNQLTSLDNAVRELQTANSLSEQIAASNLSAFKSEKKKKAFWKWTAIIGIPAAFIVSLIVK